jgi:hypothetical protein
MAAGIVGEIAFEGPLNGQPVLLNSPDAANNVIGRAFTYLANADGAIEPNPVRAGGAGAFAGILASPKLYASAGTAGGGSLAGTLALRNNELAEVIQNTPGMWVQFPGACVVGQLVVYNTTTGELAPLTAGQALPVGFAIVPGATVVRYTDSTATPHIACIALNGPWPVGAPAP